MMKFIMNSVKPARMWIDGKPYNIKRLNKKEKKKLKKEVAQKILAVEINQSTAASSAVSTKGVDVMDDSFKESFNLEICEVDVECNEEGTTLRTFEYKGEQSLSLDKDKLINTEQISLNETETEFPFDISLKDGKYQTCFRLPRKYYLKLGDLPGGILKSVSTSTNTVIYFPRFGKDGEVTILGQSEKEVCEARDRFHSVVSDIRDSLTAIQFIALPILSKEVQGNFEKFKNEVLALEGINGMDESIFMKTEKLHLTVVIFALLSDAEKEEAIKALQDYKNNILDNIIKEKGQPVIKVKGIEIMNDNPKKVDVLFAKVELIDEDEDHTLQKIVNGISEHFYDRGLVRRYEENVKLHMTLINTKYRKQLNSPKRWVKRQSIDATKILEKFKDYDFGTSKLESIRLSLISSQDNDGFYKSLSTISVP